MRAIDFDNAANNDWLAGKQIAIDGKTLRRSFDRAAEHKAIHMVTAWVYENHAAFGQVKVDDTSNEITAIPQWLRLLHLQDATVTLDAMGCPKELAKPIVDSGGSYVLGLKGNQGILHEEVSEFFDDVLARGLDAPLDTHRTVEKNHGRIEERTVWISRDVDWLRDTDKWAGLTGLVAVQSKRTINGETTTERRHYICSGERTAKEVGELIRHHWRVENELHWVLDVAFRETSVGSECKMPPKTSPASAGSHGRSSNRTKQRRSESRADDLKPHGTAGISSDYCLFRCDCPGCVLVDTSWEQV